MERFLNILQILEIVQMVCFHIQDYRQSGEEIQEGITVFAALKQNGIPMAYSMSCMKQGQVSADHHRRIQVSLHQNMGHHRGGGGLSMGTGDADSILIGLHDFAPGLCTFKHRDARCSGSCDFRIVIVSRSSTDDAVRTGYILCVVANGHRYSLVLQLLGGNRGAHIRAGNHHAHSLQHKAKRTHGHTANSHQMHMASRNKILGNFLTFKHRLQYSRR